MKTFVVIGAGATGLSTAYHLLKKKACRVILLEKQEVGAGSSSRAAGITTGLLWTPTGIEARKIALRLFQKWSRDLPGYHYSNEQGCLNLFQTNAWVKRKELLPLYEKMGVPYKVLDSSAISNRWPGLHPCPDATGLWDPLGGYSEPTQYLRALRQEVVRMGGILREGISVEAVEIKGGRVSSVLTREGEIRADAVVCAAYAWTNTILAPMGIRFPAKSFVHRRFVTKPFESAFAFPPVNADDRFGYIRPAEGNRILMGLETPDDLDCEVGSRAFSYSEIVDQWNLLEPGVSRFKSLLPEIENAEWEEIKTGLINFSIDGEPIVGEVGDIKGLFVGLAFHSGGFSYSPVIGCLLASLVNGEESPISIEAFSPNRFENSSDIARYLERRLPQSSAVRRRH